MASTIVLKRRITSIKSTRQITKALQLVAASKMRRAQEYANQSRAYGELATRLMVKLSGINELDDNPFFKIRSVKAKLYIIITSNSGLAGAYNSNVLKKFFKLVKNDHQNNIKTKVITIGNKGAYFCRKIASIDLVSVYNAIPDKPTANDLRPILNTLLTLFNNNEVDEVCLVYTKFKSNISQEVEDKTILPAKKIVSEESEFNDSNQASYSNFEPNIESVITEITTRLIEAQLWKSLLESLASEHSMRMMAMKNATDNAKDLIDDYTLELNTARQASITQELAEITGGAEAMNG